MDRRLDYRDAVDFLVVDFLVVDFFADVDRAVVDRDFAEALLVVAFLAVELFAVELFAVELFVVDFPAVDFFAVDVFFFAVLRDEPRALDFDRPEREAAARTGASGRSTRSATGSGCTPFGSSSTARSAASARSARTSEMTRAGCRAREAWTRFVRSTTNMSRSGSIQMDVPV